MYRLVGSRGAVVQKMAAPPKPKKICFRVDLLADIPQFQWKDVYVQNKIGSGSFGTVSKAIHKNGNDKEVILKQPLDLGYYEREFCKEVRLLERVKGHENVVTFEAVCTKPLAIMEEYVRFSFNYFGNGDDTIVSSLAEFLHHVDDSYDFDGFYHVPQVIFKKIKSGIAFLHEKDIVHRDLKPANILIGNHHWDQATFLEKWKAEDESSLSCKLTDFGESHSNLIQTQTILASRITKVDRGTPAYMSPEVLLPELRPNSVTVHELKAADLWALGMVIFVLINPDMAYPYQKEIQRELESCPFKSAREIFEDHVRHKEYPTMSSKYERFVATKWWLLEQLHSSLTEFDTSKRICSIADLTMKLGQLDGISPACVLKLDLHQGSAVEMNTLQQEANMERSRLDGKVKDDKAGIIDLTQSQDQDGETHISCEEEDKTGTKDIGKTSDFIDLTKDKDHVKVSISKLCVWQVYSNSMLHVDHLGIQ